MSELEDRCICCKNAVHWWDTVNVSYRQDETEYISPRIHRILCKSCWDWIEQEIAWKQREDYERRTWGHD